MNDELIILEIRHPRESRDITEPIESMAQGFAALSTSLSVSGWQTLMTVSPLVSFEIAVFNQTVHFFITAAPTYASFIENQLTAQYPRVSLVQKKDFLPSLFAHFPHYCAGQMLLTTVPYYPLRTFRDYKEADPLAAIVGTMAKTPKDQAVFLQLVLRSAGGKWQAMGVSAIDRGLLVGEHNNRQKLPAERVIQQKIGQPGFHTNIRLAAFAANVKESKQLCAQVASSFGSVANGEGNTLHFSKPFFAFHSVFRKRMLRRAASVFPQHQILNSEELASIWHPPGFSLSKIKNLAWGQTFLGEAPENLPVALDITAEEKMTVNFFAKTEFKNKQTVFGIKKKDRRRHMYIMGKTGTGKSTLIANMAINDMRNQEGIAVIDPHGDLCEILLDYVPSHRINDVVYLDPSDTKHPFHLNPLEKTSHEHQELIASGIISIFHKLYHHSWGPRLEYILRNTLLTLLQVPNATLLDIPEMLTNESYRNRIAAKLDDRVLKNFWEQEFKAFSPQMRSEVVSPILNKVGQFISSKMIRQILEKPTSTINLETIMNSGKILLVNLSQGKLGEDNSALMGAMLITKLQLAAMSRVQVAESKRRDFYLYVDEFQNFATTSFVKILSEARKYRLNLTLANQYIGQVDEDVQKAVFGNAGTLVSFLIGAQDSYLLAKEFGQVFTEEDLVSLGNYQIMLKLAIDNLSSRPFFAYTLPLPKSTNKNREKVLRSSRERYTKKQNSK